MKRIIKSILSQFGYEIRRTKKVLRKDAFADQQRLLGPSRIERIIFDIGAFDGNTALLYNRYFPASVIYSFEPFLESFQKLKQLSLSSDFIKPINMAVSSASGMKLFYVNESSPTNSLYEPTITQTFIDKLTQNNRTIKVDSISLDKFTGENKISFIDILKLDIQGGELDALRGAQKLLEAKKIRLIYCEVEFMEIYKDQPLFADVFNFLHSMGYFLFDIYNLSYSEKGRLAWGDALFVNSEFL